jgi:radical SAM protein with 4Fe4S-binding SPASM domain
MGFERFVHHKQRNLRRGDNRPDKTGRITVERQRLQLGYFDENIEALLATSEANKYFFNRTLLPQCTDCSVLNWCRGGCRAVHLTDMKAVEITCEITCKIKQEIIDFILKETNNHNNHRYYCNNCDCDCNHDHRSDSTLDSYIKDYVQNLPKEETMFVETPPLPEQPVFIKQVSVH